ncbi:imidazoleglycerol-phosphate dehydratase HisB [uncultured Helicobacter sp.]|uniref:imidazoleglycerol-phosphate dehydratase HisB n=1 Tax=uncultured Helicobacter sp. TaxID=175537 RepID=UPI00374F17DE
MKEQIAHTRKTKETDISLEATLYGSGSATISSGVGFLDHMLESFSKHSLIDLTLKCQGDTHIDDHHSVEDCGIVIGEVLGQMIYPLSGVERFGNARVVMDEACVACDIDLANRAFLVFEAGKDYGGKIGSFDVELVEEFFRAVCFNAKISAHIVCERGKNLHHITEAMFKAFGVSLRRALTPNPRISTPSTKGVL